MFSYCNAAVTMIAAGFQASLISTTSTVAVPTAAAASDIQAGTDNTKFATSQNMANAATEQTLAYSATPAWNMAAGFHANITLTGNVTFAAPTGGIPGRTYLLRVIQDSTGGRTAAFNAAYNWGAAGAPTLTTTAGKTDLISLYCVSTSNFLASIIKGF